jgi:NAD(P)-dependent dehydrogenase (short-subunit alcohol dehydrogenase family)
MLSSLTVQSRMPQYRALEDCERLHAEVEIAGAVLYLASDLASFTAAACITVDGATALGDRTPQNRPICCFCALPHGRQA